MYRIAVCDDEQLFRDSMNHMLIRYSKEHDLEFRLDFFSDGNELLKKYDTSTDVIFLDIDMGDSDGIETARVIRESNEDVYIVFITNLLHRAIEGYSVRAFGFVGKPLHYSELDHQLGDALRHIQRRVTEERTISIKIGADTYQLSLTDIIYCEVQKHTIYIHTAGSLLKTRGSMIELEEQLSSHGFFRPHASYLVNTRKINHISKDHVNMQGGLTIPLSQKKRKDFVNNVTRFLGDAI